MTNEQKRLYWLKLQKDFFYQPRIKKLRKLAGGDTMVVIYLKLMLLSLEEDGVVFLQGIESDVFDEFALMLDEEVEDVKFLFGYLNSISLIDLSAEGVKMIEVQSLIASESSSAKRVREYRKRKENKQLLQCNTDVTKSNDIKEKDIELEKDIEKKVELDKEKKIKEKKETPAPDKKPYGDFHNVLLTDEEYNKLIKWFLLDYEEYIEKVDLYIESSGKKYKSHYATIRQWLNRDGKVAEELIVAEFDEEGNISNA